MTNSFEIRSGGQLRAVSPGKLAGYAILYNSLSQDLGGFVERVMPGAVKRSLSQPGNIRALYEHDAQRILARVGSGTLSLTDDSKGIQFEMSLPDVTYARDLSVLVERGDIAGVSFGFTVNPNGQHWEMRNGQLTRDLTDIALSEISITANPAYRDTTVALRSRGYQMATNPFAQLLWLETIR
ncbi:MAG: HK97 family phage prohead protease [Collimonas pratensis]|uniref:HK97 family phage prohead protease n=1 Tax=Collimonas pratensis TaxID=279113 RepID=UPI003C7682F4